MAATTFEERLARIEERNGPVPEFKPARFAEQAVKPRRVRLSRSRRSSRCLSRTCIGLICGVSVGVLLQGAVLPGSPWGPGSGFAELAGLTGVIGLIAALPLVLMSLGLRRRRPGLFHFSIAYAVSVISVALL